MVLYLLAWWHKSLCFTIQMKVIQECLLWCLAFDGGVKVVATCESMDKINSFVRSPLQ